MRTYKGFEAIKRMKTNWITTVQETPMCWKIEGERVIADYLGKKESYQQINFFFENEFIDCRETIRKGELLYIENEKSEKFIAEYCKENEKEIKHGSWFWINGEEFSNNYGHFEKSTKLKIRKAEKSEKLLFERAKLFATKGRKINEFRLGDVVERDNKLYKVAIVSSGSESQIVVGCVPINGGAICYYNSKDIEIQFFVEDMVVQQDEVIFN
ncbi:hypothetical protein OCB14_15480 [Bacillus cereus]|nr:hypothetical protein [Bacillus cereus]